MVFPVVSENFECLYNQFIKCCNFPDCLKSAKVIPLFNGGGKNPLHNNLPNSILLVWSKVLSKVLER